MRKIYSFFLFFTFIALFSSVAAEREPASVLTVKVKTSEMGEVIGILESNGVNLKETAFFSDFDETLATTVTTYKDHEFKFLPCPDRGRTYKQVFSAAFQGFPYSLDNFSFMALSENRYNDIHEKYAVLDQGAMDLICSLCEDAYFVGVCSALPIDGKKNDLMKYVGLDADNYIMQIMGNAKQYINS